MQAIRTAVRVEELLRTEQQIMPNKIRGLCGKFKPARDRVALKYGTKLEPGSETFMVVPSTISAYCAVLASEILFFCEELYRRGNLSREDVVSALSESMEEHSVPRRFIGSKMVFEINK